MEKKSRLLQRFKLPLQIFIVVVVFISVIGFSFKYFYSDANQSKMERLERALQDLRAAMNVDSVRQYNIQKIMAIIDTYNKAMPSSQKYEIADEIYKMSVKYTNLDVDLICATITHESAGTWNPEIKSEAGAIGLMQIMPTTGMFVANFEGITWTSAEEVLTDPIYNIRIGTRYLSSLIEIYTLDGGLAAYNGGEKQAALWIAENKADGILWPETKKYIPAVLKLYQEYQGLNL